VEKGYRKWCIVTVSAAVGCLVLVAALNILIDPFFHYHKPLSWLSYRFGNQNYVNAGIVRQFEYDAVITGTSMTENFRPSYFAEVLGVNAVKTPYSGGKTKNFSNLLAVALLANPQLKTIYMGLDVNMLHEENAGVPREPFPAYLYDDKLLNDVSYLLNKDTLLLNTGAFILSTIAESPPETFDDYSFWEGDNHVPGQYLEEFIADIGGHANRQGGLTRERRLALAGEHLEMNIVPLVEAYPQVEFVFFFPPYSIYYWYDKNMDDMAAVLAAVVERLIVYDNVRLFFPLNHAETVTDIYNYYDLGHYRSAVNDYLVRCFAEGTFLLTEENYRAELEKLTDMVNGFDFIPENHR
jgi:multisubunit Na+/H+ antiporter MnhB subunit